MPDQLVVDAVKVVPSYWVPVGDRDTVPPEGIDITDTEELVDVAEVEYVEFEAVTTKR